MAKKLFEVVITNETVGKQETLLVIARKKKKAKKLALGETTFNDPSCPIKVNRLRMDKSGVIAKAMENITRDSSKTSNL